MRVLTPRASASARPSSMTFSRRASANRTAKAKAKATPPSASVAPVTDLSDP